MTKSQQTSDQNLSASVGASSLIAERITSLAMTIVHEFSTRRNNHPGNLCTCCLQWVEEKLRTFSASRDAMLDRFSANNERMNHENADLKAQIAILQDAANNLADRLGKAESERDRFREALRQISDDAARLVAEASPVLRDSEISELLTKIRALGK